MPASQNPLQPDHDGWSEYMPSYMAHARVDARQTLPSSTYLSAQPSLTHAMRKTLVRWLKDVKNKQGLHSHTLALSVFLLDRYLSCRIIPREDLQLLGIVCLFVASKYHDIPRLCMTAANVISLCCDMYAHSDIVEMERRLLSIVGFDLSWISPAALLSLATGQIHSVDAIDEEYGPATPREPIPLTGLNALLDDDDALDLLSPTSTSSSQDESSSPTFVTVNLPAALLRLAHGILEKSLEHSRFIGLSSCTLAISSLVAADRLLMLAKRMDRTVLTPPMAFHLLATFGSSSVTVVPGVAFHLANIAVEDGLIHLPPLPPLPPTPPSSPNANANTNTNATLLETDYMLSEYDFAFNDDVRREAHSQDPIFF